MVWVGVGVGIRVGVRVGIRVRVRVRFRVRVRIESPPAAHKDGSHRGEETLPTNGHRLFHVRGIGKSKG